MKTSLLITLCLSLLALPAQAGPKDYVIYVTRLGGDSASARPYISKASAYFEKAMGWPGGSTHGVFLPYKKEVIKFIKDKTPGFAILEAPLYFELRKELKLRPIAQLDSKLLVSSRLHLVVKDPAFKSIADLKGKKLWTTLGRNPVFLSKVVLDGKVDAMSHFKVKKIGHALKGVRGVIRGRAHACLIDDDQLAHAKKMQGGADLKVIYSSPALPPPPLVVFGDVLDAKAVAKLKRVLLKMCSSKQGKTICKEIMITSFKPVDTKLFKAAQKRFERP